MLLSLSRRLLTILLALGILTAAPAAAYDSDYDDDEQSVRKSKKKKKKSRKKKKKSDEDNYWDEASWEDDEVKPLAKNKKKKKKAKSRKKKKAEEESEDDDDWDDSDDSDSQKITSEDEEDFFGSEDDTPSPAPAPAPAARKTAMGSTLGAAPSPTPQKTEEPAPAAPQRDERSEWINAIRSYSADVEFGELKLIHPSWTAHVRFNTKLRTLVTMKARMDAGTILELSERALRVKWDEWGEEVFLRQADNSYMQSTLVKRSGFELSRKAKRAAARLRSKKAVPWEEYGWTGRLMDFITGNEPPLTYKTFQLVNADMDCAVRFSEEEKVLVKIGGNHEPAAVLDYTGVKLHVRWENGHVETYKRQDDGTYRKIDDERMARLLLDPDKCVREKSQDDWFQIWWRDITNEEKPLSYVNVEMKKGNEEYHPRISMDNRILTQTPPHSGWAKVVQFNRKELIIRWNGTDEELYELGDDNVYYLAK